MPAMLLLSLLPRLSANPHFTFYSITSSYSSINTSSSFLQISPKNPIQNHPLINLLPIPSATNPNFPVSSDPNSHSDAPIKVPTPPWMTGPLLLQPHEVVDLSNPNAKKSFNKRKVEEDKSDKALTAKESGVRGNKAMRKIVQNIETLRKSRSSADTGMGSPEVEFGGSFERMKENGDSRRMPWEKDERIVFRRMKKEKALTAADLRLDKALLGRFRSEAARMRTWVKVNKAGVTDAVVDEIKRIWKTNELAMVKFYVPLCRNMDRAQEVLETKTGGLVVWSKKDTHVIYRGDKHRFTPKVSEKIDKGYFRSYNANRYEINGTQSETKGNLDQVKYSPRSTQDMLSWKANIKDSIPLDIYYKEDVNCQPVIGSLYERETDRLLDGLGPRFFDWWMHKPLPVDGDLLPEVVPGFEPPFRLSPPEANSKLTDHELTYLRNLAQPLPTHFVLGRNRRLQGLASAILKLWEKSLIAKIAVKYGIPNTDNEKMANELKRLTGGTLLLRNKFFIILYRGKDFLPRRVAALVEKREEELKSCQHHEEVSRMKAVEAFSAIEEPQENISTSGTLTEFKKIQEKLGDVEDIHADLNVQLEAEIERLEGELKKEERKAFILNKKIENSAKELLNLNAAWTPTEQDADLEIITEEERQCFRKIGLKMRSCLVLGRRGIFDGVVEGLHQHWKHREVVKVITMQRVFRRVIYTATMLEAESGGVLVSVDKLKEGHAIIIYRGKNYRRSSKNVVKNLLTKREALRRSLEMQRIGSLKFFAHQRQQRISDLKIKLADLLQRREVEKRDIGS